MAKSSRASAVCSFGLVIALAVLPLAAQRVGFAPEEFSGRRAALMDRLQDGAVILFGDAAAPAGSHFRQDNDFYYFAGNEDLGAILVLVPASRASYLFLPPQTAREKMMEGANLRRKTGEILFHSSALPYDNGCVWLVLSQAGRTKRAIESPGRQVTLVLIENKSVQSDTLPRASRGRRQSLPT